MNITQVSDIDAIHALERAWMRDRAHAAQQLDDEANSLFNYAIRLGCLSCVYTSKGECIDLSSNLQSYRSQLQELMLKASVSGWAFPGTERQHGVGTLAWEGSWHHRELVAILPQIENLFKSALIELYAAYPCLADGTLESTLAQKKLVLALGGGGGTGFVHICLFRWLEELQIVPSLMTGTSIGALLGYVRALQTHFDVERARTMLPGFIKLMKHIRPCLGTGKNGLPGLCRIDLNDIFVDIARELGWANTPSFQELRIPFACVSSGILLKSGIEETIAYQKRNPLRSLAHLTQLTWRNSMQYCAHIASLITSRNAVVPISFGFDDLTSVMSAVDGISFSMLVPGVFNYELPRHHYRSREILDTIFEREHLYRLCDGGLASNVPVRTALAGAQRHKMENLYVLGIDVFAPQPSDGIFFPLQQIANVNALVDAAYSDAFVRLKYLLSPMNLTPSVLHFKWLNSRFRFTFASEMKIVQYALKPLTPMSTLDLGVL